MKKKNNEKSKSFHEEHEGSLQDSTRIMFTSFIFLNYVEWVVTYLIARYLIKL